MVKTISVVHLKETLETSQRGVLIDVRTTEEYEHLHAPAVKRVIEHTEMAKSLDRLPADKSTPIYLICRSGNRSGKVARLLMDVGYSEVFNVAGGMLAWLEQGFPVETGRGILDSHDT